MITPNRRRSSMGREDESTPALASASLPAHKASGSTRETCLRSFFSTHASSSKSETSPAICTSICEESKREIRFTPLRPSSTACPKASAPVPFGLTTPIPVITQRRFKCVPSPLEPSYQDSRAPASQLRQNLVKARKWCNSGYASDSIRSGMWHKWYVYFATLKLGHKKQSVQVFYSIPSSFASAFHLLFT